MVLSGMASVFVSPQAWSVSFLAHIVAVWFSVPKGGCLLT